MLFRIWIKLGSALIGGYIAYLYYYSAGSPEYRWLGSGNYGLELYVYVGIGALLAVSAISLCYIYASATIARLGRRLGDISGGDMAAGLTGLLVGLLVAVLLYPSVAGMSGMMRFIPFAMTALLGAAGLRLGLTKRDELLAMFAQLRSGASDASKGKKMPEEHKILDTSVIIDGRIADICKTGFIQGILVIPEFVLEELQHIADSSDLLKRNRGRRGLDILNKIQKELDIKVLIYEGDFDDVNEVDSKLVRLAKLLKGKVITNDFNLNKVCELQGVSVLNINDLANAVKPVVLPGEEIVVQVIKDGKEYGQGVAYLDDGTMIVVEGGREFIGTTLEVMVTSVLQTSAGRMIFAKPKLLEKAL